MFPTETTWARAFLYEYSSRLRNFGGFKLVTNLKETKEAKCKLIYSILSKRYTGPSSRRASFSFM